VADAAILVRVLFEGEPEAQAPTTAAQVANHAAGGWQVEENTMNGHRSPYVQRSLDLLAERMPTVDVQKNVVAMKRFILGLRIADLSDSDRNALSFKRPVFEKDPDDPKKKILAGYLPESELENAIRAFHGPRESTNDFGSIRGSEELALLFARMWQVIEEHHPASERLAMKIDLALVMAKGIEDDNHRTCGVGMNVRFVSKMGTHFKWMEAVLSTPSDLMEEVGPLLYQMAERLPPRTDETAIEWQRVGHTFHAHAMAQARNHYPTEEEIEAVKNDPKNRLEPMGPSRLVSEVESFVLLPLDGDDDYDGWRDYKGPPAPIPGITDDPSSGKS
jgi:hypothetical protein